MKQKDYREVYRDVVGACASCKHALTRTTVTINGKEEEAYKTYDGKKHGGCCGHPDKTRSFFMPHDTPDMSRPINECWEPNTSPLTQEKP